MENTSSSKSCPIWKREYEIVKMKVQKNITYQEVKLLLNTALSSTGMSYSAAVTHPLSKTVTSTACQTDITWVNTAKYSVIKQTTSTKETSQSQTDPPAIVSSPIVKHASQQVDYTKKSDRIPKGSRDQIFNKFQLLEDMDVSPHPRSRDRSKSLRTGKSRSPVLPPST